MTAKNWCFTDYELLDWATAFSEFELIKGLAWGQEICPDTGRKHLQGFVHMKTAQRLSAMKKIAPRAHWERMRGTITQNKLYCEKEGRYTSLGEFGRQGHRTDLTAVYDMLVDGATNKEITAAHPATMIKYHAGISKVRLILEDHSMKSQYTLDSFAPWIPITDWSRSHVFYGPAGSGKSEFALAHFENALWVTHMDGLQHFCSTEHDGIIFDDMFFDHIPRESCIHIVDQDHDRLLHIRYMCARIPAHTKKIFTTNRPGGVIFKDHFGDAIQRRLTFHELNFRN